MQQRKILFLMLSMILAIHCQRTNFTEDNVLEVQGESIVRSHPGYAKLYFIFEQEGENMEEVQKMLNERVQKVFTNLTDNQSGLISGKKYKDSRYTFDTFRNSDGLLPIYETKYDSTQQRFVNTVKGYKEKQNIWFQYPKEFLKENLSKILEVVHEHGGLQKGKIKFVLSDEEVENLREELTKKAVVNALQNAKQFAQRLGLRIEGLRNIEQYHYVLPKEFDDDMENFTGGVYIKFTVLPDNDFEEKISQGKSEKMLRAVQDLNNQTKSQN